MVGPTTRRWHERGRHPALRNTGPCHVSPRPRPPPYGRQVLRRGASGGYIHAVSRDLSASDDFVGCVAGNLRAAARSVTRVYDAALRDTGLRITQIAVLAQIQRLQPLTVTELAAGLSSERSAVARDVAILQRDGLVSAVVKADDQRARDISLTPEGRRRLAASAPAWHAAQEAMRTALGPVRVDELVTLAKELAETLEAS